MVVSAASPGCNQPDCFSARGTAWRDAAGAISITNVVFSEREGAAV